MVIKNNNGNAEIWCDVSEIDSLPTTGVPDFMVAHVSDKDNGVTDYVFNPKASEGGAWVPVVKAAEETPATDD